MSKRGGWGGSFVSGVFQYMYDEAGTSNIQVKMSIIFPKYYNIQISRFYFYYFKVLLYFFTCGGNNSGARVVAQ